MNKKLTFNDVLKFIEDKGDSMIILYNNLKDERCYLTTKIKIKCSKCKKIYNTTFYNYQKGHRCKYCAGNMRLTYRFVNDQIEQGGDKLISKEYKNARSKLEIKCNKCETNYFMCYDDYKNGRRCGNCCFNKKKTYEEVRNNITLQGDRLISETYRRNKDHLEIQCGKCEKKYKMTYSNYLTGNRCRSCSIESAREKRRHSYDYVKSLIEEYGDKLMSDTYYNSSSKIDIKCGKCDNIYKITFCHYKRGVSCFNCNKSRGERKIERYLINNNISYVFQKRIQNCKNIRCLPFDFEITVDNITALIEYNGIHHYNPVEKFGGEEYLKKVTHNDMIKKKYCKDNNIKLLIIPYEDYKNINEIIEKFIKDIL